MAMSDCDKCWETPCTCGHGYERPRMSLARLREVVAAATRVLADREASGDPEPALHPQQRIPAELWILSIPIHVPDDPRYLDACRTMGATASQWFDDNVLATAAAMKHKRP